MREYELGLYMEEENSLAMDHDPAIGCPWQASQSAQLMSDSNVMLCLFGLLVPVMVTEVAILP